MAIDLHEVASRELEARGRFPLRVKVCTSTGCMAAGAADVLEVFSEGVCSAALGDRCSLVQTGCMGPCTRGPLVAVEPRGGDPVLYQRVGVDEAVRILTEHVEDGTVISELTLEPNTPFLARQTRVVLANAGKIDPTRLEDYVAEGGYLALEKAITTMTPAAVVDVVKASGLRGRGGAGYPTGNKWAMLAAADSPRKYVIANGDEGDPGAFMDRTVMQDDPHRVVEGLAIAAYATGADHAYIYVRAESPKAIERLDHSIRVARRHGLLGKNILGAGFDLEMEIRVGAGAYVCGEETALMASIEGKRGQPRLRPPYPTERGVFGYPSMINNVETLANVSSIVMRGAEWFRSMGTPSSPGTKVFALAGDLVDAGLIEVPMGITLREVVEEMAGGMAAGKTFKAAQTGGPSGGCIPARHLDTPLDYESLKSLGSMIGSGGLIVMDEDVSMPELARFFMQFCMDESCGKCVPCRAGTAQIHGLLDRICRRDARRGDLALLEELCHVVRDTSLCGLGQGAPNPVISTLRHFRPEYEALVRESAHV